MDFKDAIIEFMALNNLKYREFAELSKISLPYLMQLLNGTKKNPSRVTLKKIELLTKKQITK